MYKSIFPCSSNSLIIAPSLLFLYSVVKYRIDYLLELDSQTKGKEESKEELYTNRLVHTHKNITQRARVRRRVIS